MGDLVWMILGDSMRGKALHTDCLMEVNAARVEWASDVRKPDRPDYVGQMTGVEPA